MLFEQIQEDLGDLLTFGHCPLWEHLVWVFSRGYIRVVVRPTYPRGAKVEVLPRSLEALDPTKLVLAVGRGAEMLLVLESEGWRVHPLSTSTKPFFTKLSQTRDWNGDGWGNPPRTFPAMGWHPLKKGVVLIEREIARYRRWYIGEPARIPNLDPFLPSYVGEGKEPQVVDMHPYGLATMVRQKSAQLGLGWNGTHFLVNPQNEPLPVWTRLGGYLRVRDRVRVVSRVSGAEDYWGPVSSKEKGFLVDWKGCLWSVLGSEVLRRRDPYP